MADIHIYFPALVAVEIRISHEVNLESNFPILSNADLGKSCRNNNLFLYRYLLCNFFKANSSNKIPAKENIVPIF